MKIDRLKTDRDWESFARSLVQTVLRNHPSECVFAAGAAERIVAAMPEIREREVLIDYLVEAIEAEEVFCPHEGIDRTSAFLTM